MTFEEMAANDSPEEYARKIKEAVKAEYTPVPGTLDVVSKTALLYGKEAKYQVSLSFCPCRYFSDHKNVPCKHMYRLAHELGIIHIDGVQTDPSKINSITKSDRKSILSDSKNVLADCPIEEIMLLNEMIYAYRHHKDQYPIVTNDLTAYKFLLEMQFVTPENDPNTILSRIGKKRVSEYLDKNGFPFPKESKTQKAKFEYCLANASATAFLIKDYHVLRLSKNTEAVSQQLYEYTNGVLRSSESESTDSAPEECYSAAFPVPINISIYSNRVSVDLPENLREYVLAYINDHWKDIFCDGNSDEEDEIVENQFPVYTFTSLDDLAENLKSIGIRYVDKRGSNGCFWIPAGTFFDDIIRNIEINGKRFKYAKSPRTFDGRQGWYMK